MKVTKREKFMLFQALEWEIHRYLMSNTYGREDGNERAERHMNISAIIFSFITLKKYHEIHDFPKMKVIHDYLAEILTDRMDEVIGFPIYKEIHDYDDYPDDEDDDTIVAPDWDDLRKCLYSLNPSDFIASEFEAIENIDKFAYKLADYIKIKKEKEKNE